VFRSFLMDSPMAEMIGRTIGANHVRAYFDAMFVKQPGSRTITYWHADHPAWPVKGEQVPTAWMPLLPVRAGESCLEFIAGSQTNEVGGWPNTYNAKKLGKPAGWQDAEDWETRRNDPSVKILSFDMDPGDVLVIHSRTHHGGGANLHPTQPRIALSTRWFGDAVVWDPRPECINSPGMPLHRMTPGAPIENDEIFPVVWRREAAIATAAR
jgi:ectoine hydroxylase-related dioxygenase (phytanoyl-CoA dioxygenase family)